MTFKLSIYSLTFLLVTISCSDIQVPDQVQPVLERSQSNKGELLKALKHYSGDSLKFKAVSYLIINLDGKYYFEGELLDKYMQYPQFVLKDLDHGEYIMKSFGNIYGPFSKRLLNVKFDIQEVTAEQLISNIDASFSAWKDRPWAKDYSFSDFCNYVIPYRIMDEKPSYSRADIYQRFRPIIDSIQTLNLTAVKACKVLNDVLIKDQWVLSQRAAFLPHYNASTIIDYRVGSCREMGDLAIYVMRSVGIPVSSDFLPQWPYRSMGHNWNVVFDKTGKAIPFLGAEDSPGTPHKPKTKKGKVYRNTSQINPSSLALQVRQNETIPSFLYNPCITDVTDEYVKTHTVKISCKEKTSLRFGFLSVFNNVEWVPIDWSILEKQIATFYKVEGNIVYLPTYFNEKGVSAANNPFVLDSLGQINYLIPDTVRKTPKLTCKRLYPVLPDGQATEQAVGGKFQGANKADFSDAKDLFKFTLRSLPFWNEILTNSTEKFRYVRYISSNRYICHVTELEFHSGGKKLRGKIIANNNETGQTIKAFDSNELTGYNSNAKSSWIGLDLGFSTTIDKIRFFPQLEEKSEWYIVPGTTYTLKYWNNLEWRIFEKKVATSTEISFDNVPSNALYLLTTGSKDERIFTYSNGEQVWW